MVLAGLFVGSLDGWLAILICGLLALIISIHETLKDIRQLLADTADSRVEEA